MGREWRRRRGGHECLSPAKPRAQEQRRRERLRGLTQADNREVEDVLQQVSRKPQAFGGMRKF